MTQRTFRTGNASS